MLRDDRSGEPRRPLAARNVLGEPIEICSLKPMTGFYRDGCCNTGPEDVTTQIAEPNDGIDLLGNAPHNSTA